MSTPLARAVAEAAPFLGAASGYRDEVDVSLLCGGGIPALRLGTLRALYELAADFQAIFAEYTPEEVARALAR